MSKFIHLLVLGVTSLMFLLSGCGSPETQSQTTDVALPLIDTEIPSSIETASFALGWFWGSDAQFGSIDGVIRTRVGYAGGTTIKPTYYNIGDYSETVQVDYDPTIVSYEQLVLAFWSGHDPSFPLYDRQYRSAIFYSNDEQKKIAIESKKKQEAIIGKTLHTDIEALIQFYVAEDYHQKYYMTGNSDLMSEMKAIYPDQKDFMNSTAVARLNGYIGGFGDKDILQEEIDRLGLSERGEQSLLKVTEWGLTPGCPVTRPAK